MSSSQWICTQCGAGLSEDDIDARQQRATCRFCGALNTVPAAAAAGTPAARAPEPVASDAPRPHVPQPDSIGCQESVGGLRLTRRWFTPALFFLLFFCIAWDGFLVVWYMMLLKFQRPVNFMTIIMLVFPICHVAIGAGLTYLVIAGFLNRTLIEVSRETLRVWHGPVPWAGNKQIAVDGIAQLYFTVNRSGRRAALSYVVYVLRTDGRQETLASQFSSADEARYVVRTIEDFLGLPHHPVADELT